MRALLPWLVVALLVWYSDRTPLDVPMVRADFGATAAIAIISFLGSLFGLFGGKVDKNLKRALEGMRAVIVEIGRTVAEFFRDVGSRLADVWGWLRRQWRDVIRPFIADVDTWIRRAFQWLKDTFGPIIEALLWLRAKILAFYAKWFRPIFDTLDALRRILGLFGFLGADWARNLDRKLAELEERLERPIRFIVEKLNRVIDVVDRIVTLDGLLQRYTLIRSLILHQRDALKVWWTSIHKPLTPEKRKEYEKPLGARAIPIVAHELRAYVIDHDGPDRARIDEHSTDLALRLRGVGVL